VGKTTLIKLKIRQLLGEGVDARRIFYWTCDQIASYQRLTEVVDTYISWARRFTGDRLYLFLDEVSSVRDWQRSIKYLYDTGRLRQCLVLVTGSHSLDLRRATESLAGRCGEVDKLEDSLPDKVFLGAKFSGYVETRDTQLFKAIRANGLLSRSARLTVLRSLARGEIPSSLRELELYLRDLQGLLEDYLVTGGIPRSIHNYVTSGRIPNVVYSDYVNLILRDISRWGGREVYLRQIAQRLVDTLASRVSWSALREDTEVANHETARTYVETLKECYAVVYLYQLRGDRGMAYHRRAKKIYFCDPFIFHAVRWWVTGAESAFEQALDFLKDPAQKGRLLEAVLCDHLVRLLFNLSPTSLFDYSTRLFYWVDAGGREVDFVFRLDESFLPIELKYQSTVRREDLAGVVNFQRGGGAHRAIIATKDTYMEGKTYTGVPLAILLLLA